MPQTRSLKAKTERFFDKFTGRSNQEPKKNNLSPRMPAEPLGAFSNSGSTRPTNTPVNELTATFHGLSISNPTTPAVPHPNSNFIGGFNLGGISASCPTLIPPARPPMMPVPQLPSPGKQSLTMQYARDPDYSPHPEFDEFTNILLPPCTPQSSRQHTSSSPPRPGKTAELSPPASPTRANSPSTPIRPSISNRSSGSQHSTPSRNTGQIQCAGITKTGKRCTRQMKADFALDDSEDEEEDISRFCFQHKKEVLEPSGYYAKRSDEWVSFEDWIPPYLQESTQASLRAEMVKPKSAGDGPGYIYTFEIRDPDAAKKTIKLKVGRTNNPVKRIDQWAKQCGSKEQVLRGLYPANVEDNETSLMKGRVQAGPERSPWCHRLERLVHIELRELVSTCVYLQPGWPSIESPPTPSPPSKASKNNGSTNGKRKRCPDCGSMHKEIFEFKRWEEGGLQGKEWEKIVKGVIERWGRFVDLYV